MKVKLLLPKQHGAWAMLILPFILGMAIGAPSWLHIPLFIAWLMLYLATYPLIMVFKNKQKELHLKWVIRYSIIALFGLVVPVFLVPELIFFGLAMFPFFLINIYYGKRNNDRALLNDFSAIAAFGIGGVASYYVGQGELDQVAIFLFLFTIMFFIGSTFFVKTLIREKKNPAFRWISWGYHVGVILFVIAIGYPFLALAYLPSVIRAIWCYGKTMSPKQIGILEIFNSVYFLGIMVIVL
ncbi:YwiC-like family protein [Calidifontibacillus oryziterrae]|uniref:YwiC-like family protein n=1 Tax=Calidifontibacillus oryziterrae TaxID=1191699 RepID=UPI00054D3A1C|nr:YwiC-like family protein [Calidifontibacillus oryziterrae]